jgi:hypothetical protein
MALSPRVPADDGRPFDLFDHCGDLCLVCDYWCIAPDPAPRRLTPAWYPVIATLAFIGWCFVGYALVRLVV